MSNIEGASPESETNNPPAKRWSGRLLFDWIFGYGITSAAVVLAMQSVYVFITGAWTLAESLAAAAKLLAMVAVVYFLRFRINR